MNLDSEFWWFSYRSCYMARSTSKETEVAGADQLSKPICDSDSDEYRDPDSSSKGEGG
jgi:hypothetical protein